MNKNLSGKAKKNNSSIVLFVSTKFFLIVAEKFSLMENWPIAGLLYELFVGRNNGLLEPIILTISDDKIRTLTLLLTFVMPQLKVVYDRTRIDRTETEQQNFTKTEPKPNQTIY